MVPKRLGTVDLSEGLLVPGIISSMGAERKRYYDLMR